DSRGLGGLPVGSLGRGVLLLSGGIDSPVAGYLMAKRGLRIDSVYFHTHPFTSPKAREKVEKLSRILSSYFPSTSLFVVSYTEAQLRIKELARPEEATLLSRACMMKIASRIAKHRKALCLVTGESLGQVASQTVQGLTFTGGQSSLPVFRPLIGMDKQEIIALSKRIGTYETSILPHPDCCTLFSPPHPLIHPRFDSMVESFARLELEPLIDEAAQRAEEISYPRGTPDP
ncbi:MAG TPA: tRNA 4-thiouridine(8) synthase ThiI, partial [Spirochaetia bacterium]|nr:tRNA 4-thiouridine(8) synthase ThiI [Spirochaetia bacterium]